MGNDIRILNEISSSTESVLNNLLPLCSLALVFGMFYLFKSILKDITNFRNIDYSLSFDQTTAEENIISEEEDFEEIEDVEECVVIQEEVAPECRPEPAPKIKSRYTPRCPNCWGFLDEDNVCRVCKMVIKQ